MTEEKYGDSYGEKFRQYTDKIKELEAQIEKMKCREMSVEVFEEYLMMHKHGMPPHGGLGIGLERFTARLLQFENVRSTTLFPRDINRVTP